MTSNVKISGDPLEFFADFADGVGEPLAPPEEEDTAEMLRVVAESLTDPDTASAAVVAQLTLARKRLGQARQVLAKLPGMGSDLAIQEALTEVGRASIWVEEARACLKEPLEDSETF